MMTDISVPVYFYFPPKFAFPIPEKAEDLRPKNVLGSWIVQTYMRLKEVGFSCKIVEKIPDQGIVIAHRIAIPIDAKPSSQSLWVIIKGDQNPHPYAQICIVQNAHEVIAPRWQIQSVREERYLLPGYRYYMPHWPQPGIIPRNSARGEKFENIAYFGISYNLAEELRGIKWQQMINKIGLNWCTQKNRDLWFDYNYVDAILAVRSFSRDNSYPWKPASKLYNAWNAGVPAILGSESAFQAERKSYLDYIEVTNVTELIEALKRLKNEPKLRQEMIENGWERAKETRPETLTKRWSDFLTDICVPAYENWCNLSSWERQQFFIRRSLALKISNIGMKSFSLLSQAKSIN
jgi:hypothetical protein